MCSTCSTCVRSGSIGRASQANRRDNTVSCTFRTPNPSRRRDNQNGVWSGDCRLVQKSQARFVGVCLVAGLAIFCASPWPADLGVSKSEIYEKKWLGLRKKTFLWKDVASSAVAPDEDR